MVGEQANCRGKCLEDLQSTTRYVTWSLHTKSRSSLKQMLSKVRARPHLTISDDELCTYMHARTR